MGITALVVELLVVAVGVDLESGAKALSVRK